MDTFRSRASRPFATFALAALAVAALLLAALPGCGGGSGADGGDGVGSGGTGTYSMGPIAGFGSIVVNGVRYDESAATVLDEDDAPRSRTELRLGTIVEVDADDVRDEAGVRRAAARRVRVVGALVGPVEAVDAAAGTLRVLGQTVKVGAGTVIDERLAGGLAALGPGRVVEVHALYDTATARHAATRIEPAAAGAAWQVRGQVEAVDLGARALRVGGAGFTYGAAGGAPTTLGAGDTVRLRVRDGTDAQGRRPVESFLAAARTPEDRGRLPRRLAAGRRVGRRVPRRHVGAAAGRARAARGHGSRRRAARHHGPHARRRPARGPRLRARRDDHRRRHPRAPLRAARPDRRLRPPGPAHRRRHARRHRGRAHRRDQGQADRRPVGAGGDADEVRQVIRAADAPRGSRLQCRRTTLPPASA